MRILIALVFALSSASAAAAHEFWISPPEYQIDAGAPVVADVRVGENFKGSAYSYIEARFERFDVVMDGQVLPVPGRTGDRPAMTMALPDEGLAVIVHETTDSSLRYSEFQKFLNFVEHKDFKGVEEAHRARGIPDANFKESYRRFAKSLVAVGHGKGQDTAVGLTIEIVALANPYTDDISQGFPVQVLFEGQPVPDTQVELFARPPEGDVTATLHRTDTDGKVVLPMQSGFEYLVDSVALVPVEADDVAKDVVWHSLWASLTLKIP